MKRDKFNVLQKLFKSLISAITTALRSAIYGSLLPTIVLCQGLAFPTTITSQNHSNSEFVIQSDLIGQPVLILWRGFSPDGKFFAWAEGVDINVWEVESGKLLHTFKGKPGEKYHGSYDSWSVAFSPDSKLLASGSDGNALRIWHIESGEELKSFEGKAEQVRSIAFSPDGKLLATGGDDKSIRLWDVGTGREIKSYAAHDRAVRFMVFSPDGKRLASSSSHEPVKLWDVESGKLLKSLDVNSYVIWMAFLQKGKVLVYNKDINRFGFSDTETGQEMKSLNDITRDTPMIFSPDGKLAAGKTFYQNKIRVWEIESGKELLAFEPDSGGGVVGSMIFSPDGKILAIKSDKNTISFLDVESGKLLKSINGQDAGLWKFLPDGKILGFSYIKKTIYRWDFKSGEEFTSTLK